MFEREKNTLMAGCVKCKNVKFFKTAGYNYEVSIPTVLICFRDGRSGWEVVHDGARWVWCSITRAARCPGSIPRVFSSWILMVDRGRCNKPYLNT
jgi:hypothetical protein